MAITLTTLTAQVYARLGVPTTDAVFDSTTVTGFINDALREIATEHDWPWLETGEQIGTSAGSPTVTPGTGLSYVSTLDVLILVGTLTQPLERLSFDDLLERYPTAGQGRPAAYALGQEKINLRPIPDSTYTIQHYLIQAEKVLASGSDTPLIPDAYSPAVANLAVAIALGRSKEDSRAVAALNAYNRWLGKMLDNRRRDHRPSRVRVRAGSWL